MISESDLRLQPFLDEEVAVNPNSYHSAVTVEEPTNNTATTELVDLEHVTELKISELEQLRVMDSHITEKLTSEYEEEEGPSTPKTLPTTPLMMESPDDVPSNLLMSPGFDAIGYLDDEENRMEKALEGLIKLKEQFLDFRRLRGATRNQQANAADAQSQLEALQSENERLRDQNSEQRSKIKTLEQELSESRARENVFEEKLKKLEDISFKIKFERMQEKADMYMKHCKDLRDRCSELEKGQPTKSAKLQVGQVSRSLIGQDKSGTRQASDKSAPREKEIPKQEAKPAAKGKLQDRVSPRPQPRTRPQTAAAKLNK